MPKTLSTFSLVKPLARAGAALTILFLFTQCGATYYTPNNQNVGQLSEEKEIMASGGFSRVNQTRTLHYQAAYSPVQNLGIKFSGATFTAENEFSSNFFDANNGLDGQLFEGSVGYYLNVSDNFIIDLYGGFGRFNGQTEDFGVGEVDFSYNRYFLQPALGLNSQFVDLILSLRLSALNYSNMSYEVGLDSAQSYYSNDVFGYNFPLPGDVFYFIEPVITLRVGIRQVKLEIQTGFAFNYSARPLDYDPFQFGVGVVYNFKPSYKENPLNTDFLK